MRVVIIGAGQVGSAIAQRLTRDHHDIVVVDTTAARLAEVAERVDVATVVGTGCSPVTLRKAGIPKARMVIAVTDSDEVNLLACVVAGSLAPDLVQVARVRDPEFHEDDELFRRPPFGLRALLNPEEEAARRLVRTLRAPGALDVLLFAEERAMVLALYVEPQSPLAGKTLIEIGPLQQVPLRIVCLDRRGHVSIPQGRDRVQAGDVAYIVCLRADAQDVLRMAGKPVREARRVMVYGGGNVALYVARELVREGVEVKLLFNEEEACRRCAELIPGALVVQAQATEPDVLVDEGIADADAFIACSREDERNLPAVLLAKSLGARIGMLVTNNRTYEQLAPSLGIDAVTSPQSAIVGSILQLTHRKGVHAVSSLWSLDAEVVELEVDPRSRLVDVALRNTRLPPGGIIAALTRGEETIIPTGKTVIRAGDHALVVARTEAVPRFEKVLAN